MVRFAVFTDLHYDNIPDGNRRLKEFLSNISNEKLDFIISLGDLCCPNKENKEILTKLEQQGIPVYYTLGNHDTYEHEQNYIVNFFQMERDFYSFQLEGIKFIVLNSCYMKRGNEFLPYDKSKYDKCTDEYPFIPESEVNWLQKELSDESLQYVIFSHHSLVNEFGNRGITNREKVRDLLEKRNVLLCMNGHDHGDDCKIINSIPYYTLNSMSYIWHCVKEMYSYAENVHKQYPFLKDIILYQQPLHCIVELENKQVKIIGMQGQYQTISPQDVGIGDTWNGVSIAPRVSDFCIDNIIIK